MPSWSTDACPSGAFSVVQRSFGWQFLWRNWWCFPLGFGGTLFQTIWDDDEATSRTLLLKTLLLWLLDICFCGLIPLKPVFLLWPPGLLVTANWITWHLVCWLISQGLLELGAVYPTVQSYFPQHGWLLLVYINTYGELGITTIMTMKVE